jgi:putative hydrolase of the HAD superfamily
LRRAYHHGGYGFEAGFEATEETSFARTMQIDSAAMADLGIEPMPESFFRRLSELFMLTANWHVFPDVTPALAALRERGLVVGAVSNWVWQLPELLHALQLVSKFDFIAASSRVGFEKPHPEIFRWALEQARVEPAEAIHVGDHLDADVAGARGAGIQPVLIDRRDRFAPGDVPTGTPLIRSLTELIPIVDARLPAKVAGR